MAGLNDTHPEAEQVPREAYRKMSFAAKWRQMGVLYRNPSATEEMIQEDWRMLSLGKELYQKVKEEMSKQGH